MEKKSILDLERLSTEQYKEIDKLSFVVVLDNIRSLNNIGSVFRTSDAFLVEKIYLCGITATPPHPDIHKTALGAEDSVEWVYFNNTIDAVEKLQSDGYIVYAIEQVKDSFSLQNMVLKSNEKYALVLGNEVKGVQQEVVDKCNGCIEIPQFGTKHSLNVSVTAGLVIWDFFKQLYKDK
ncbi:MAG: RNA methyltransferase [Bacteroidaceae bacterium]|nr:RNA methyltransferase [Bacteroidaceae bacterium]